MNKEIVVVGGCGHVGLPLGVKLSEAGFKTSLVDIDQKAIDKVNSGQFPFLERGGDEQLQFAIKRGLRATRDANVCRTADAVVFVIGTPVDEHLNPKISDVIKIFDYYVPLLKPGTLIIMRSTLFPGTMEHLKERLKEQKIDVKIAFCPERVAQGYALEEIDSLPQIVSAYEEESFQSAYDIFKRLAPSVIRLTPIEAEMTKLMANSWRYLEFAIANQFYMIAESKGVDFFKIYDAIRYDYPRASGYKSPGLAAGPCLFKDTMQLASFFDHQFYMGHSAMLVNEGLAGFLVDKVAKIFGDSLWGKKVALLGMTFKANNDDIRESLSYRLKKGLEFKGAEVLDHDPYLENKNELEAILEEADALVIGTPHDEYKKLALKKPCIDVWGIFNRPHLEVLQGEISANRAANS
ncbi:MAG TPA: nucleotide sugar dehydrogenase [Oligoflexia bacterium]|nr:nucleotide sugar dehydrogenase [Oligoflexia bacterium]HMP47707.1 nucleotide sugar dehydrogenase [Oligoflexia bacterium]